MKASNALSIILSGMFEIISVWSLPISWFLPVLAVGISIAFFCAVAAATDATEEREAGIAVQVLSLFFLNTSRPHAIIQKGWPIRLFIIATSFVFGLVTGVMALANV